MVSVLPSLVLTSLGYGDRVHGVLAGDPAGSLDVVRFVLLEQELDAAGQAGYDLVLLLLDFRPVDLDASDFDAVALEVLVGVLELVGDV